MFLRVFHKRAGAGLSRMFCDHASGSDRPIAVVTGASRGIGRAIALSLADAGCRVVINYAHNENNAQDVANLINGGAGETGAQGIVMRADCSDSDAVTEMFSKIRTELGTVDILVILRVQCLSIFL